MGSTRAMDLSDPATFARAYDEHRPAVYGAALRVLGNPATAQDVAQDVFLRLWRRPAAFDARRGDLGAYLRLMARSRALDLWRSAQAGGRGAPRRETAGRAGQPPRARSPEDRVGGRRAAPGGAAGRPLRARRGRADRPGGARRAAGAT